MAAQPAPATNIAPLGMENGSQQQQHQQQQYNYGGPQQQQQQMPPQQGPGQKQSGQKKAAAKANKGLGKASDLTTRVGASATHGCTSIEELIRFKTGHLNGIDMLLSQHRDIESLLAEAMATHAVRARGKFLVQAMNLLSTHMRIEEEIFYPAVRYEAPEGSMLRNVHDDHDQVKQFIAQLRVMDPADPRFNAMLQQLTSAVVQHHRQEEGNFMPAVRKLIPEKRLFVLGRDMHKRAAEISKLEKRPAGPMPHSG